MRSWLYAIVRNTAVDHIRHSSRLSATPIEDMENCIAEEEDLEQLYIKEERKILVHRALSRLPADYRTVLWLVFFEGFSNREVSVALKKSDRQVKNLLYRAKQSLKTALEKEGFVYENL